MANIGTLAVSLTARTDKFDNALDRSLAKMRKFTSGQGAGGVRGRLAAAEKKTSALASGLKRVAIAGGAAFAVRSVGGFITKLARADSDLKLFRARLDALGGASISVDQVVASADRVGVSFDDAAANIQRFLIAGENIGLTNAEVLKLQENIAAIGRITGAGGAQLSAGMLQLGQAIASNNLAGDELRSILENIPGVAKEIAKGFGVGVGDLKQMGKDSKLTGEQVARILINVEGLSEKLATLPPTVDTINQKLGTQAKLLFAATGAAKLYTVPVGLLATGFEKVNQVLKGADAEAQNLNADTQKIVDDLKQLDAQFNAALEKREKIQSGEGVDLLGEGIAEARGSKVLQDALGSAGKVFGKRQTTPELKAQIEAFKTREDRVVKILENLNQTQIEQLEEIRRRKADPKFDATFG